MECDQSSYKGKVQLYITAKGTRADPVVVLSIHNHTTEEVLIERDLLLADVRVFDEAWREVEQMVVPGTTTAPSTQLARRVISLRPGAFIQRDIHLTCGARRLTCATLTRFNGTQREEGVVVAEEVRKLRSSVDVSQVRLVNVVYGSLCGTSVLDEVFMDARPGGRLFQGPLYATCGVHW